MKEKVWWEQKQTYVSSLIKRCPHIENMCFCCRCCVTWTGCGLLAAPLCRWSGSSSAQSCPLRSRPRWSWAPCSTTATLWFTALWPTALRWRHFNFHMCLVPLICCSSPELVTFVWHLVMDCSVKVTEICHPSRKKKSFCLLCFLRRKMHNHFEQ